MKIRPDNERMLTYLGDAVFHNLLAGQVGLVADEQLVDTLRCVLLDVRMPCLDVCGVARESVVCHRVPGQVYSLLNDRSSVTSYTKRIPIAPQ